MFSEVLFPKDIEKKTESVDSVPAPFFVSNVITGHFFSICHSEDLIVL